MPAAAAAAALLPAALAARVYYAHPAGSAANVAATRESPLSFAACAASLRDAGDECHLLGGTYGPGAAAAVAGAAGTADRPVHVRAAAGARVTHDGTAAITGDWTSAGDGVWTTTMAAGQDVQQLWVDGEMMTPARWPNALWRDKSVFDWTTWSRFNNGKPWGPFPANTPDPIEFWDAGALGKAGLDVTGAMFVGNIAHMDTFVGTVTKHSSGADNFSVQLHINKIGNSKSSISIYFLENLAAFIDQPTEWSYDKGTRTLSLKTDDGKSPAGRDVRRKVQTYALNVTGSTHVKVSDMSFFGTTLNAHSGIGYLSLSSLEFRYPSFSARALGSIHTASPTRLDGDRTPEGSSFDIFNCTWMGADGPTLHYTGTHPTVRNCLWEYNDWSAADDDVHTGLGGWVLDFSKGSNDVFERNTMKGNGPSVAYACGQGAQVRLNRFSQEGDVQNDGALVQIRSGSATNTVLQQNWGHDSIKGFRLDSGSNSGIVPGEKNNSILQNVAMYTNGYELKNDNNVYRSNLALFGPQGPAHGSTHGDQLFRVDNTRDDGENAHSINQLNVATSWLTPVVGVVSADAPNVFNASVDKQLRDPKNFDFRPVAGSAVDKAGAGPYLLSDKTYWIPGRQEMTASSPIPPDGATSVRAGAELMFLHAYGCAEHAVHFGASPASLTHIGTLRDTANIQAPPAAALAAAPNATFYWRVDGCARAGPTWSFRAAAA